MSNNEQPHLQLQQQQRHDGTHETLTVLFADDGLLSVYSETDNFIKCKMRTKSARDKSYRQPNAHKCTGWVSENAKSGLASVEAVPRKQPTDMRMNVLAESRRTSEQTLLSSRGLVVRFDTPCTLTCLNLCYSADR